jgi:hypothetical protein
MIVDLNHKSGFIPGRADAAAPRVTDQINAAIDAALTKTRMAEERRNYLGASIIGDPCARRVALRYLADSLPDEIRVLRIFETGRALEALLADWTRRAGFALVTEDPRTGRQFEFVDGPVAGHSDGVIVTGPQIAGLRYPLLWEAKTCSDKSWNELVKLGVRAARPLYYGQTQLYLAHFRIEACLLSAINKNDQSLYHEIVPFDLAEAQRLTDRAVEIWRAIEAGQLPPITVSETLCRHCEFRAACYG